MHNIMRNLLGLVRVPTSILAHVPIEMLKIYENILRFFDALPILFKSINIKSSRIKGKRAEVVFVSEAADVLKILQYTLQENYLTKYMSPRYQRNPNCSCLGHFYMHAYMVILPKYGNLP